MFISFLPNAIENYALIARADSTLARRNPADRQAVLHSVRAGDVRFWPWAKKWDPFTYWHPLYPPSLCFALSRPYPAHTPPQGSFTGERRVEETVHGLCPSPLFRFPVAKSIGSNEGRDGVGSVSVSGYRKREEGWGRAPLCPPVSLFVIFLRGNLLGSLRPHVLRVPFSCSSSFLQESEKSGEGKRKRGEREPWRLMEYIMMRPAVLRRLNGRVCVLRKRWSRRRREVFAAGGQSPRTEVLEEEKKEMWSYANRSWTFALIEEWSYDFRI